MPKEVCNDHRNQFSSIRKISGTLGVPGRCPEVFGGRKKKTNHGKSGNICFFLDITGFLGNINRNSFQKYVIHGSNNHGALSTVPQGCPGGSMNQKNVFFLPKI